MPDEKPKLIIDSDWKAQAQAEKEKLAAEEAKKAAARPAKKAPSAGAGGAGGSGGSGGREMPPADFQGLVGSLVTQALMYMGGFPDPKTGRAIVAPEYARYYIDLLGVLEEKTKGNTSAEEAKELAQVLNELRMRYVEVMKALDEMAREEAAAALKGGAPGGGGGAGGGLGGLRIDPSRGGDPSAGGPGKLVY